MCSLIFPWEKNYIAQDWWSLDVLLVRYLSQTGFGRDIILCLVPPPIPQGYNFCMAGQSWGAPIKGCKVKSQQCIPTAVGIVLYFNVDNRSLCLCVGDWGGCSKEKNNRGGNKQQIFFAHKLSLELFFFSSSSWVLPSILLSPRPFVSEQLCGCAYIMFNPAGQ